MNHVQCTSLHTLELRASATTGETAAPPPVGLWGAQGRLHSGEGDPLGQDPGGLQDLALVGTRAAVHVSRPRVTVVSQGVPGAMRRLPQTPGLFLPMWAVHGVPAPWGLTDPLVEPPPLHAALPGDSSGLEQAHEGGHCRGHAQKLQKPC